MPIGLGKRYRQRWALRDCTLQVPAGRVVGLVGPNGAGKTTLLHLAVGLLEPSAGHIAVLGGRPAEGPDNSGGSVSSPRTLPSTIRTFGRRASAAWRLAESAFSMPLPQPPHRPTWPRPKAACGQACPGASAPNWHSPSRSRNDPSSCPRRTRGEPRSPGSARVPSTPDGRCRRHSSASCCHRTWLPTSSACATT